MKWKKIGAVVLSAAMLFTLWGCSKGNESAESGEEKGDVIELKFSSAGSDNSTWQEGALKFGELLSEYTDGKYKVTVYPSDQLSGGNQAGGIELVQNGSTDIHLQDALVWSSVSEKSIVASFPWLLPTYEDVDTYMAGEGGEALKAAVSESGVVCLALGENGYRQVVNTKQAIASPEDMQGMKLRVPGSAVHISLLKNIGADPISMNQSEVYSSLQQGTIDGCENTLDLLYSQNTLEVVDYLTFWNYSYDPLFLSVSQKLWDSLSEEEKEAFTKAAEEAMDYQKQVTRDKVDDLMEKIGEEYSDLEITKELTEEQIAEFQEAVAPVYEEYREAMGEDLFKAFGYTFQ
ncbi:MAG: DctP family TRAP transporter solute-binding subunit [Lachnospiraceae bacterium]|nr:DctP family TRAP transporter solute-binding subunit [Lachnospiraceae bacterium]